MKFKKEELRAEETKFDISFCYVKSNQRPQAQYESLIHVVLYCVIVILKMAVNIKNLYRNSGKRFKMINTR